MAPDVFVCCVEIKRGDGEWRSEVGHIDKECVVEYEMKKEMSSLLDRQVK